METSCNTAPGTPVAAPGVWARSHYLLTVGLLLTVAATAFEALAIATTLPATVRELGGLALYGWAFSAFMLTNLVGITLAGGEADRHGPARPFVIGVILFALGLLISGFARAMIVVIIGRGVQGFGAGAIGSVAYVAISRGFPEAARARMLALLSSAWVVPGLIGPGIAGVIGDHLGWRWVFLLLAPLAPLSACMAWPALRRLPGNPDAERDWRRIGASIRLPVGVAMIVTGLGLHSAIADVALVVVGLGVAIPALRQLLPPGTLQAKAGLPATIATMGLLNLGFFGADAFVPLALRNIRGQSATGAGLALTAATICWSAGSWVQARRAVGVGRRGRVMGGQALIAVGIGGMALVVMTSVPALLAVPAWAIAGLGMGLAYSTISLVVLEQAAPGQEGTTASAMQLVSGLGTALGTGLGGVVIAAFSNGNSTPPAGILTQDVLMIGVLLVGIGAAGRFSPLTHTRKRVPASPTPGRGETEGRRTMEGEGSEGSEGTRA